MVFLEFTNLMGFISPAMYCTGIYIPNRPVVSDDYNLVHNQKLLYDFIHFPCVLISSLIHLKLL